MNDYAIINGLKIYSFKSSDDLIDLIGYEKKILIAINAEKIMNSDVEQKSMINENLGYCDGIGAVIALKKMGLISVQIPGFHLWLEIISKYYNQKSFYFVGGRQEVIDLTIKKIYKMYPTINIKNFRNGYFDKNEDEESLILDVAQKKPDIVFVAMGSPKQELLMTKLFNAHPAVYQGLGGSFDVFINKVKSPDGIWMKLGLMWLIRIFRQPRLRLKRLPTLIKFLFLIPRLKKL
tara:strand:+ start:483 stop:1187 length:705 start_codon:yes stop_codon:yes gene_type:complete